MTIVLESGEQIELTMADSYAGPGDCFSGQHVNSTATFIRALPNGEWKRVMWGRSFKQQCELARLATTAAEAIEVLCEEQASE